MKTMKVQVEHLQPITNTQETTQGSVRDPRVETLLKAISQVGKRVRFLQARRMYHLLN